MTRVDFAVPNDPHVATGERRFRGHVRGAPLLGTRTLTAILPDGRVVWLTVNTPLAPATSLANAARLADGATRRQEIAVASRRRAITRLAQSIDDGIARLSAQRVSRAAALRRRLAAGDGARDRRLSQAVADFRRQVARQIRIDRESIARLRRRDWCDKAVIVSAWPLFAAYGQQGRPHAANNLALTLSLLTWLVGDELVAALFDRKPASPYAVKDADVWSYVAPFANLLAGWWMMNDLPHGRFVSGVASGFLRVAGVPAPLGEFHYEHATLVDLSRTIAPGHLDDFRSFAKVPVVASVSAVRFSAAAEALAARTGPVSATVFNGALMLSVTIITTAAVPAHQALVEALDVAWIVDTAQPSGVS
ncbi:MAG: hypothetical protein Q8O42_13785 [Acidobacteriota bacterium]|nr:hypothetical protein [Acidobacteriota bacterium]